MIDKALKDKPVLRVPRTDVIRTAVASPEWAAAIGRRLIAPYPARSFESALSIQSLQATALQGQRHVTIVQVDESLLEAACQLGVENSVSLAPGLLLAIGCGLQAPQRHGLRCSGIAAIFESFVELEAMEKVVSSYFKSLPEPQWSLEQQIAKSI